MELSQVCVLYSEKRETFERLPSVKCLGEESSSSWLDIDTPVVALPPCVTYSQRHRLDENHAARCTRGEMMAKCVQINGGIMEVAAGCPWWSNAGLPLPWSKTSRDFTLQLKSLRGYWKQPAVECWYYICGVDPDRIPPFPLHDVWPKAKVGGIDWPGEDKGPTSRKVFTPLPLAEWMVAVARLVGTSLSVLS